MASRALKWAVRVAIKRNNVANFVTVSRSPFGLRIAGSQLARLCTATAESKFPKFKLAGISRILPTLSHKDSLPESIESAQSCCICRFRRRWQKPEPISWDRKKHSSGTVRK